MFLRKLRLYEYAQIRLSSFTGVTLTAGLTHKPHPETPRALPKMLSDQTEFYGFDLSEL